MNTFIDSSTAAAPLGLPTGQKCLAVPGGPYAGRTAIIYASSASTISLTAADSPYNAPADPLVVITDAADSPFDAWMDDSGDIFIAYTTTSGNDLGCVKLTFSGGAWSAGAPVVVFDADDAFFPAIRKLTTGQLWIVYTRLSGGSHYISAKVSIDDGASWGGSSDPGDTLTGGADEAFGRMVECNNFQFLFYSDAGDRIAYRAKANSSDVWGGETILASEGGYDEHLSARVSPDGRIGLAYASSSGLKFREFTGSYWTGEAAIDTGGIIGPMVLYSGDAIVLYGKDLGDNLVQARYARREDNSFAIPDVLDVRKADLKSLLVYNAANGTYQDRTAEAASAETADIFHSTSGSLLSAVGDALFLGLDEPYNFLRLLLSASGAGGEAVWKYWDGQTWCAFIPQSGSWHFTDADRDLLLWDDFESIPSDWQKKTISGATCYWISATVSAAYTTAPIGSRITAVSNLNLISAQV